ncbi:MAG: hypothetical protein QGD90_07725 [Candidatus Hydrogenedentes bacterium]|nr:hypothetical protein [Candidatus Hydrogenedentota bacterium]
MNYLELSKKIPLYLAGRMNAEERAELEALAGENAKFQNEIDELLPTFEALTRDFEAASQTTFQLSAARRAELRRATHVNVLRFPAKGGRPGAETGAAIRRAAGRVLGWTAVASALIIGIYSSLDSTRPRSIDGTLPLQHIATEIDPLELSQEQFRVSNYVYPPGYGLDKPDIWSLPERGQPIEFAQAALDGRQVFDLLEMFNPDPQWDPAYYGLDGPRPYYRFPSLRVRGAI